MQPSTTPQSIGYREYSWQDAAFDYYDKFPIERQKRSAIVARDLDVDGTFAEKDKGSKKYGVIEYTKMIFLLSAIMSKYRCFYELIKPYTPTKLYFDIDGQNHEQNMEKIEHVKNNFHGDFYDFWDELTKANEFGCRPLRSNHEGEKPLPRMMNVYGASNAVKFSQHIIFPEIIMENNFHCGAVFRRLELFLLNKYGEDLDKNPYYMLKKNRKTEEWEIDFAIDRGVYTINRVLRLAFNSKAAQNRPIRPIHMSVYNEIDKTTTQTPFSEIPGQQSEDMQLLHCFLQWFDATYEVPKYFSCCEVRSWSVNELSSLDDSSFDPSVQFFWIEPASIGNKIISISIKRLSRMKYTKSINKAGTARSLSDSSQSSMFGNSLSDSSNSAHNFMDDNSLHAMDAMSLEMDAQRMKTNICMKHIQECEQAILKDIQNEDQDDKMVKKIARDKQKLISSSRRYILSRCAPEWWPVGSSMEFDEMSEPKTFNIKSGRIYVYPRRFKRCQFKGFQFHQHNNIFFAIYCNPSIGEIGFLQKCIDPYGHPGFMVTTAMLKKLHEPYRNQLEKDLFENVQSSMRCLTLNIMNTSYPLIQVNPESKVSSWILMSIVNVVITHFINTQTMNSYSTYNQIMNSNNLIEAMDKINNHVSYLIDLDKKADVERTFYPSFIDEVIIQTAVELPREKGNILISKYLAYRSQTVMLSLMNVRRDNNFNYLKEQLFIGVMRDLGVSMHYPHALTYSNFKSNSIVHIHRLAALTEARIFRSYMDYINGKSFPPIDHTNKNVQYLVKIIVSQFVHLFNATLQHM
jgi:hypothetical protein